MIREMWESGLYIIQDYKKICWTKILWNSVLVVRNGSDVLPWLPYLSMYLNLKCIKNRTRRWVKAVMVYLWRYLCSSFPGPQNTCQSWKQDSKISAIKPGSRPNSWAKRQHSELSEVQLGDIYLPHFVKEGWTLDLFIMGTTLSVSGLYCHVSGVPWLIITGFGLDDWIFWHFYSNYT
jgi:hypothetical protein